MSTRVKTQKLLIVGELPAKFKSVELLTQELDIEVLTAETAKEGLSATNEHDFSLILIDIKMPDMNGIDMIKALRENQQTLKTPVIVITESYDNEPALLKRIDLGAVDFITKEINQHILISKIKVFLELDKTNRQMKDLLATLEERVEEKTNSLEQEFEERQRAEERVTRSERRLRAIVNTASDGIFMFNDSGLIRFWNAGCEKILGYSKEEALELALENIIPYNNNFPKNRTLYETFSQKNITPSPALILTAKDKKGNETQIELSLTGWEAEAGGWNHVAVFRDVGERIIYQEALEEAVATANEANLAKTQFLANMSHELRTPLNAIIGFSELILDHRLKYPKAEEIEEDINIIHASGKHLLALINEVLDISKVEAGRMELNIWPVDLPPLIKTACQVSDNLIKERNNELIINCPEDVKVMNLDPKIIKQILMNLINNAAKFTKDGTITVNLTQEKKMNMLWAKFDVIDTGIGIKKDSLDLVFERFSQVDDSHTREYQGTGLGLALVKTFVEFMGGNISVKSTYGEGSTFTMEIPDSEAAGLKESQDAVA
ncbi:ATP-binding protein [Pseudemcibacter aquimaris]|uniref:ATP-binding protein n=1 Tax=Pseudemcibacter aquimaris TaxID=2857064 RepID=UPI002011A6E7|nr:ATP-binding protein [Pseudemcibacter aquimaris]MCC3860213.1 response regulator [Pseudemcibacter aquimaris]WDU57538.1 response regulator [Pseudemcibacter aquimaris]